MDSKKQVVINIDFSMRMTVIPHPFAVGLIIAANVTAKWKR
jgi:hypothetical protein